MDFIKLLKEKAFKRYSLHVIRDKDTKQYKIVQFNEGIDEEFFRDLAFDLSLPLEQKTFNFSFVRNDFKGFKNACVQSVIKQNVSWVQFDNLFHSFYKNIPLTDLLNAVYVKTDYNGKAISNSVFQPYISYFLKQDFSHQDIYPNDFIQILKFNYHITEENYPDLKESLYSFLNTHAFNVKNKIRHGYTSANHIDNKVKEFENSLYNCMSRFIKPQDMKMFNEFWPHILIKSTNDNMMTSIKNTFVFDLNYSYLSEIYPQITNESIAHKSCDFIQNIINNNLNDYMHAYIIQQNPLASRFVIEFKKSLTKDNLPDIFDSIIDIQVKTNQFTDNYLKAQFQSIFQQSIISLHKQIAFLELNNQFPDKNIKDKKLKI